MSEAAKNDQKNKKKTLIIALLIFAVLVIAGLTVTLVFVLSDKDNDSPGGVSGNNTPQLGYQEGVVVLDENALQQAVENLLEKTKDGYMTANYNREAVSGDGSNFVCYINNSPKNKYDMYINIYLDGDLEKQVLLTGLIPVGSGIDKFVSEIPLEPGQYNALLVLTQVEDDHSTIHAQAKFDYLLTVKEQ